MASPVASKDSERIGDLLVREGLISKDQLEKALQEQRQSGTRVGYNLVKLGFIQEIELTSDSPGDARSFLAQHPLSYPSYQASSTSSLSSLAVIEGLPTTIFINSNGKVVFVHTGQYDSQGTLDADIAHYAQAG